MKTNENLQTVFTAVAAIFAGRYDLSELTSVTPVPVTKYRSDEVIPNTLRAELNVTPRGQIAAIVRDLDVTVEVAENDGRFCAVIKMSYNHVEGGSNGKDTAFVVITDVQWGSKIRVVDVITRQAEYTLQNQWTERSRANLKGKTAEELFAVFNK